MAIITKRLYQYPVDDGPSYALRMDVPDGDVLNIIGLPKETKKAQGHGVTVRVFPVSSVAVSASGDTEANIIAGTSDNIAWPDGTVTDDTEGWIRPGSTGIIVEPTGGACAVQVTA